MDILSLKYFLVAAEYGSFSKAAEYLYTTQPNISKHIQKLEKEMAVELFHRTGLKMELTDVGRKCLIEVQEIIKAIDQLNYKINKYKSGEYGNLRIGSTGEFKYEEFTKILSSFGQRFPNIDIFFVKGSQSQMPTALFQNEVDVILTSGFTEMEEGLFSYEIAQNELVLAVPEGHALAGLAMAEMEDLREQPIIFFQRNASPNAYDWILKYLRKYNLHHNIVSYENDLQSLLLKVVSGKGVAIVSKLALMPSDRIKMVHFQYDHNEYNVNLSLIWKKDNKNPSLSLFLQNVQ